jgi:hypothetical protein
MFEIGSALIGFASIAFLGRDFKRRQNFNEFKKTNKTDDGCQLLEGTIRSNTPLNNTLDQTDKLAIIKTETQIKSYHTYYDRVSLKGNDLKIKFPVQETVVRWKNNGMSLSIAPNIKFNEIPIYFPNNAIFHWDSSLTVKNGDIRKVHSVIKNGSIKTILAEKTTSTNDDANHKTEYRVEMIGNREQVISDVKLHKYGISDWLTFGAGVAATISIGCLIESIASKK